MNNANIGLAGDGLQGYECQCKMHGLSSRRPCQRSGRSPNVAICRLTAPLAHAEAAETSSPQRAWLALAEIALVFVVFFLHGAWPTPDVNETGYLAKAAHYWDHNTFANDFFCNTADAHWVYYWTFGWLTKLGFSF